VTVIGAGASALDLSALLHQAGASTRLVARTSQLLFFDGDQQERSALQKMQRPTTGVGPGWRNLFACEAPSLFARLPGSMRADSVRRMLGPAAGRGVRDRVEGKVNTMVGCRITELRANGAGVRLDLVTPEGPRSVETEHVVAATGYRPDIRRLQFIAPDLAARLTLFEGAPSLSLRFESSVAGLFFVGLSAAYRFGPVQRFVYGSRFAAKTVARALG